MVFNIRGSGTPALLERSTEDSLSISAQKQQERRDRIASLPPAYFTPFTKHDETIINTSLADIAAHVRKDVWQPTEVLQSFGKKALRAHAKTNCITEILIPDAENWAETHNKKGPLAGVPISLKDSVSVKGYDSTIGYSSFANKPIERDSPLVRLLKDAGAIPFVKTAAPISLMCEHLDLFSISNFNQFL